MKYLFPLFAALFICCGSDDPAVDDTPQPEQPDVNPPAVTVSDCVRGADVSWYTEMAADGKKFYTVDGRESDCMTLMQEIGMEAVRLRVWVQPENKGCHFSDCADVVRKAVAAKEAGLRVMIDFHYSDWWADPSRQETPAAWTDLDEAALLDSVGRHTTGVLTALRAAGVTPEWIQVGNETRNGMLHPTGQLWNNSGDIAGGWQRFVALYNAGYEAAKEVFPTAKVMPHLNHAYENNLWWFDKFKALGGKFDMIALSHYPQVDDNTKTWTEVNRLAVQQVNTLHLRYGVPVVISEVGVKAYDPATGAQVLADFLDGLHNLNAAYGNGPRDIDPSICAGIFYWEPEVYGNWKPASYTDFGWGAYDMGAFTNAGQPNAALLELLK